MNRIKQALLDKLDNNKFLVYLGVFFLALFYVLTCLKTPFKFQHNYNYHIELANSLINGRVDLVNPKQTHDLIVYDGKYYLVWGIMPSVILIPFVFLFGSQIGDTPISCVLGVLSIIIWFSIYRLLRKDNLINITNLELLLLTCLSVFGTDFYYISTRGTVWFLSQTFLFIFLSLSIFFIFRKGFKTKFFSSVFFSLGFLTRTSVLIIAPLFYLMILLYYFKEINTHDRIIKYKNRRLILAFIIIAVPLLVSISFQLYYNYIRFDDPLETGFKYHDMASKYRGDFDKYGAFSTKYVPHNLFIYFCNPVRYKNSLFLKWPLLDYDSEGNSFWSYQFSLFIAVIALYKVVKGQVEGKRFNITLKKSEKGNFLLVLLSFFIGVTYLVFLLFYMGTGWITFGNRYILDVQPFLSLIITFSFNYIRKDNRSRIMSFILIVLTILVLYQAKLLFNGGDIMTDILRLLIMLGRSLV